MEPLARLDSKSILAEDIFLEIFDQEDEIMKARMILSLTDRAAELAQMTNEEKANYRAKKAEDALKEMQRQNARSDMAKEARKMLADEDINIPDELVMNLVAEDADGTKAAVETFSTMYKEAVQKAVKDGTDRRNVY